MTTNSNILYDLQNMADGRRHSVDLPISKTLVALRRVRSLRDPSTNAMSRFSALVDNENWEVNSSRSKDPQIVKDFKEGGCNNDGILRSKRSGLNRREENGVDDYGLDCAFGNSELASGRNSRSVRTTGVLLKTEEEEEYEHCISNQQQGNKHELTGRNFRKRVEEAHTILPSESISNEVNLVNESIMQSSKGERINQITSRRNFQHTNRVKSSVSMGDDTSCLSSPCPSSRGALSNRAASLFIREEVDVIDCNDHGCGLSCYWSKTPKVKEASRYSYSEDCPLLCPDAYDDATRDGRRDLKPARDEITTYSETPCNLSQKFRPKSFDDLVGQNVVARTLSGAILKGRIASFYLFHGPRGTGKTSAARIFAAALNCLSHNGNRPCGSCRECGFAFSGWSKDIKEVDLIGINKTEKVRSLIKKSINALVSSRFKVFIVDECHMMHEDTWATLLSSREYLPRHIVFVMITPHLDKLPPIIISCSQQYYFPKIKDADIAGRLEKICLDYGLDFDRVALDFIAAKSSGSIRDAQMTLEQLSLLGKKITLSMAHELIGIVSDDELLDLLDLALSSDNSNTVIKARELMRSGINPMQLVTQLANIIMDILAGKCDESNFEARKEFVRSHTSETELQKLSHALKILLEAEKRLRISKHQTTWLTVALLQLSNVESSLDANELKLTLRDSHDRDSGFCRTFHGENFKNITACSCDNIILQNSGLSDDSREKLEPMWQRVAELCQSNSLKNFLLKQGKLIHLSVNPGLAVAEIEFYKPDHVSRAERYWKLIASSLQSLLGCNVEIRIKLGPCATEKSAGMRKPFLSLFSCSRRMKQKWQSTGKRSDYTFSGCTPEEFAIMKTPNSTCPIHYGSQDDCCPKAEVLVNLRNEDGNILSTRTVSSCKSFLDNAPKTPELVVSCAKEEKTDCGGHVITNHEPVGRPNCFPRSQTLPRLRSSDLRHIICCIEHQKEDH